METQEKKVRKREGHGPSGHPRRRKVLTAVLAISLILVGFGFWARWRPARKFIPGPPAGDELRIVTWNVGYLAARRNKAARLDDTDAIVAVLRQTNAHLISLQELGSSEQIDEVARGLEGDWSTYCTAAGHPGQFLGALSRLPVSGTEEREAGGKKMLGLCLQLAEGRRAFFLSLHAPSPTWGKAKTLEYIRAGVAWARDRPEEIRVMAGDLNWHFPRLDDGAGETDDLYREIRSFCADSTAAIGPSFYAHTRIDHVFHAPESLPLVASGSGMMDPANRYARTPGWRDHRPIVVTIKLPEGSLSGKVPMTSDGNEQ